MMKTEQRHDMTRLWAGWLLAGLIVLGLAGCGQKKDTHPGQPVTKREAIFKQILRTLEPMGRMVRGNKDYDAAEFLQYAAKLQTLSTQPWPYFTPGSVYSPSRVKNTVWSKPDEFKAAQQKFISAVTMLHTQAATGNMEAIRPAFHAVESSCKSCHQEFRGPPR